MKKHLYELNKSEYNEWSNSKQGEDFEKELHEKSNLVETGLDAYNYFKFAVEMFEREVEVKENEKLD